jgi:hypothetical protein
VHEGVRSDNNLLLLGDTIVDNQYPTGAIACYQSMPHCQSYIGSMFVSSWRVATDMRPVTGEVLKC